MREEAAGAIYGLASGPLAEVDLLVSSEQHEEGKKVLEGYPGDEA